MRLAKVEIEVDQTLIDEVIQRYRLHSPREAVNLALRSLVTVDSEADTDEDEDDPFGSGRAGSAPSPRRRVNPADSPAVFAGRRWVWCARNAGCTLF